MATVAKQEEVERSVEHEDDAYLVGTATAGLMLDVKSPKTVRARLGPPDATIAQKDYWLKSKIRAYIAAQIEASATRHAQMKRQEQAKRLAEIGRKSVDAARKAHTRNAKARRKAKGNNEDAAA